MCQHCVVDFLLKKSLQDRRLCILYALCNMISCIHLRIDHLMHSSKWNCGNWGVVKRLFVIGGKCQEKRRIYT